MADRAAAYRFRDRDRLTAAALNARFLDINARVLGVEIERLSEDEAFAVVLDRVLSRSEDVISSLREQLLAITQLQWLTSTSSTPAALEADSELYLIIDEADRGLFAPGPFAVLTRAATPDEYAVVRTVAYDRESGQWDIAVEALEMDDEEHDDWLIAAIAGSTLAQLTLLEEGKAVRDVTIAAAAGVAGVAAQLAAVEAARDLTLGYRNTALEHRNDAQAARDLAIAAKDLAEAAAASVDSAAVNARLVKLELGREARATPAIVAGVLTLDLAAAAYFEVALNANITNIVLSGVAAAGTVQAWTLDFVFDGTPRTIAWPAAWKHAGTGSAPTLGSTNGKHATFAQWTADGGTKVRSVYSGETA